MSTGSLNAILLLQTNRNAQQEIQHRLHVQGIVHMDKSGDNVSPLVSDDFCAHLLGFLFTNGSLQGQKCER